MPAFSVITRIWCVCGALLAASAVIMSALAAHLPDEQLAQGGRAMLHNATDVQMWHALALISIGLRLPRHVPRLTLIAGFGLLTGTLMFVSGVCYTAFSGHRAFHIAPTGGSLLIISWCILAYSWAFCKSRSENSGPHP
ncbi:DUF423 domain-containing protein [Acetobacter thailandicus]|uniref:DUF423 domain-containing protein n=1 Tax=Acetobacter thailandicus TaxID=1502842 RepID=A0ABT3QGD5_9PROT|nr:DUF423 domain-containing protein [Acetobacter thailandicus]MCX2564342.1 DUF423 domain-containing protein [Acetobacter thailandicus]NHN95325.1 DUF423 domain-containing protein [Acetobacter thailandicus]